MHARAHTHTHTLLDTHLAELIGPGTTQNLKHPFCTSSDPGIEIGR